MQIWKTITIGQLKDKQNAINALEHSGVRISICAREMLDKVVFQQEEEKIDLVKITVNDLFGDSKPHTTSEIYTRAEKLGLELCPAEVALALRLEYQDQPLREWIYVGMNTIADSDGYPGVFKLDRCGDGLWLDDSWADPDDEWYPGDAFVFLIKRSEDVIEIDPLKLRIFYGDKEYQLTPK